MYFWGKWENPWPLGRELLGNPTWRQRYNTKHNGKGRMPGFYLQPLSLSVSTLHTGLDVLVLDIFLLFAYFILAVYGKTPFYLELRSNFSNYANTVFPYSLVLVCKSLSQMYKNPTTVVKGMALLPLANLFPGPSFCSVADELPGLWIAMTYDPPLLLRSLSSWIYVGIRRCVNLPWKPCAGKGGWFFTSVNTCFLRLTYMGTLGLLFGPKRRSQAFIVNRWCC